MAVVKVDLREISVKNNIPYSDVLWEYVLEDFLWRIGAGGMKEVLWLKKASFAAGERIAIYHIGGNESKNTGKPEDILQKCIVNDAAINDRSDIVWAVSGEASDNGSAEQCTLSFEAECDGIKVPFSVEIINISDEAAGVPVPKNIAAMNIFHGNIEINTYSPESILAEQIFEIMEKLELVSDMKPYAVAYSILKENSVSGRHIVEIFRQKAEAKPRVVSMRRLEQVSGYRSYAYMRRRWQQHSKRNRLEVSWEDALDLILEFLTPVWSAFCNNEIFFDDWMPELGRFLG